MPATGMIPSVAVGPPRQSATILPHSQASSGRLATTPTPAQPPACCLEQVSALDPSRLVSTTNRLLNSRRPPFYLENKLINGINKIQTEVAGMMRLRKMPRGGKFFRYQQSSGEEDCEGSHPKSVSPARADRRAARDTATIPISGIQQFCRLTSNQKFQP